MTVNLPGLVSFRSFQKIINEVLHRKHMKNTYETDISGEYNIV